MYSLLNSGHAIHCGTDSPDRSLIMELGHLDRITFDPRVMGGKPCLRGMRVTVGTLVGLVASGHDQSEILRLYPYLEAEDVRQALVYAAWRAEEVEVEIVRA
jgi:uncharacterized protein (DUF433 family)